MAQSTAERYEPRPSAPDQEPIRGDAGASILGPRNLPLESENPDQLASPYTDFGTIPNFAGITIDWPQQSAH